MGRIFKEHLEGTRVYCCMHCNASGMNTHLALASELVSKQFHSRSGKAYLFNTVSNVFAGPREERLMTTGMHVVRDCFCNTCLALVGWRYDDAADMSQKYKVDKFILERAKVVDVSRVPRPMLYASGEDTDSDCT